MPDTEKLKLQPGDRVLLTMRERCPATREIKTQTFRATVRSVEFCPTGREWKNPAPFYYFSWVPDNSPEYVCGFGTSKLYDGWVPPFGLISLEHITEGQRS